MIGDRFARRVLGTVTGVRTDEPAVGLTFDDGPDPEYTPRILDVLAEHGARATFFVVGRRAEAHPELIDRMVAEGHAVANHTWSHPSMPSIGRRERLDELRRTAALLEGRGVRLFRPPFGHQTRATRVDALLARHEVVCWSRDIQDWVAQPADRLAERLGETLEPGRIVLLHDGLVDASDPRAQDRGPLVEALSTVLPRVSGRVRFLDLPALFRVGPVRKGTWHSLAKPGV